MTTTTTTTDRAERVRVARANVWRVHARTGQTLRDMSPDARAELARITAAINALSGRTGSATGVRRMQGWAMLDGATTRRITDGMTRWVGREYHGIDPGVIAGKTLDRIAAYLPTLPDPYRFTGSPGYQWGLAKRIAEPLARRAASGGGSMARLPDDFERAPGDLYSPWLDSYGLTAPAIGNTTRAVGVAPGIPERDAEPLARVLPFAARIAALDPGDRMLALRALDLTYMTTRGRWSVPWSRVARGTGQTARNARERVARALLPMLPPARSRATERVQRPVVVYRDPATDGLPVPVARYDRPDWFAAPGPVAWTDPDRIAPPQLTRACCPAHSDPDRANRLRAVTGRPALTTTRCRVAR